MCAPKRGGGVLQFSVGSVLVLFRPDGIPQTYILIHQFFFQHPGVQSVGKSGWDVILALMVVPWPAAS